MTTIDKAAMGWSVAIVAVAIVFVAAGMQGSLPTADVTTPTAVVRPSTLEEPSYQEESPTTDPFADIASEIRQEAEQSVTSSSSSSQMQKESTKTQEREQKMEQDKAKEKEQKMEQERKMEQEKKMEQKGPETVRVEIPVGTSVPGCEETNECYIPASITINVGDTVEWDNVDIAAHTVTSGSPADGPSGVFDSSLLMAGATFAHTFEDTGSYDYFCMVHPWMVGDVQVN